MDDIYFLIAVTVAAVVGYVVSSLGVFTFVLVSLLFIHMFVDTLLWIKKYKYADSINAMFLYEMIVYICVTCVFLFTHPERALYLGVALVVLVELSEKITLKLTTKKT